MIFTFCFIFREICKGIMNIIKIIIVIGPLDQKCIAPIKNECTSFHIRIYKDIFAYFVVKVASIGILYLMLIDHVILVFVYV